MKAYFYPKSLHTHITAFAEMFNNMTVRVYNPNTGEIVGVKEVPVMIAPKEKIASILVKSDTNDVDPQADNYLPRISINPTGFTWTPSRMRGKYERRTVNIEYTDSENNGVKRTIQTDIQPVPYEITFELSIWAKYVTDAFQLFENITPWFAPEAHISIKERNFGIENKCKVTLNNVLPNIVFELGESERRVVQYNYSFTMEAVVYRPLEISPDVLCGNIKIANVPCTKTPFEGDAILLNSINAEGSTTYDTEVLTTIRQLDNVEEYDLMVKYWESANNSMKQFRTAESPIDTFRPCVMEHCSDDIAPRPEWAEGQEPPACGPTKQPSRAVKDFLDDNTPTLSLYSQEVETNTERQLIIVSYRTTINLSTNEIIEENVIIPNEEYPLANDLDGDGIEDG